MDEAQNLEMIHIKQGEGYALVTVLPSYLDMYNMTTLRDEMESAFALREPLIIVSLENIKHMDSSAFGGFLKLNELMATQDRAFVLVAMREEIQRAAQFLQLGRLVMLYPTVEEALQAQAAAD